MAVSTYTSTAYNKDVIKAPHIGNCTIGPYKVQWTAAGTVGDILFLAKVPHGARVVAFEEYHSNGETAATMDFGFNKGIAAGGGANASCLISGGLVAVMNRNTFAASPAGWLGKISLSDTDPIRYATLIGKAAAGTFTTSVSLQYTLTYRMDETDT